MKVSWPRFASVRAVSQFRLSEFPTFSCPSLTCWHRLRSRPMPTSSERVTRPGTYVPCSAPDCGVLVAQGQRTCPAHSVYTGTSTSHWRRIRGQAFARAGFRCEDCGSTDNLTGHLDPAFGRDHLSATANDVVCLCVVCHGRRDGQRAGTGARGEGVKGNTRSASPRRISSRTKTDPMSGSSAQSQAVPRVG